jgi:hypothetical protein
MRRKRLRLPLYGERPLDRALRPLFSNKGFGFWFERTALVDGGAWLLWQCFDSGGNPRDLTITDGTFHLLIDCEHQPEEGTGRGPAATNKSRKVHKDLDPEGFDEHETYWAARRIFAELAGRWLRSQLKHRGFSALRHDELEHVCCVTLEPIFPLPESAGCYVIACGGDHTRVKIGQAQNIAKRLRRQTDYLPPVELLAYTLQQSDERDLHERFYKNRIRGEWFRVDEKLGAFIVEARRKLAIQARLAKASEGNRKRAEERWAARVTRVLNELREGAGSP